MRKEINRKGISLVALVITIIVIIILTAAVVITGVNVPSNAQDTVKMHNKATMQDAVTIYIMTSMLEGTDEGVKEVKDIVAQLYDVTSKQWTENVDTKLGVTLTQEEIQELFTLDEKGLVGWVDGQEPAQGDEETQTPAKTVSSIVVTTQPTTTAYTAGDTFDITGLLVTATYSDNTQEDVTNNCTFEPSLDTQLETTNNVVTITYEGKSTTVNITVEEGTPVSTLGSLITGPSMYGTEVTGYNGNGIESWQVLYEQMIGTEEYVYIIPTSQTTDTVLTLYPESDADSIINNAKTYFGLSSDFDIVEKNNENYKATAWLLDTSNWEAYKDTSFGNKVVGVIGAPTMEMMVLSYNAKNGGSLEYTVDEAGYSQTEKFIGRPYVNGDAFWLACPSTPYSNEMRMVGESGNVSRSLYSYTDNGLRPVVCLKASIPATLTEDGKLSI